MPEESESPADDAPAANIPVADSLGNLSSDRVRDIAGALAWSLGAGARVYLGPCDGLDVLALGEGVRISIDLAAAGQDAVGETAGDGVVMVSSPAVTGDYRYILNQPVWHDTNCPGGYVIGQVLNWEGAPVAGVRVELTDPWNNRAVAVSKAGATDAGRQVLHRQIWKPANQALVRANSLHHLHACCIWRHHQ